MPTMTVQSLRTCALLCALLPTIATPVSASAADAYPNRPTRIILPAGVGGSTDVVGRIMATQLSDRLGTQMIADNRAGAGGVIGVEMAAKSPPDGHTLLLVSASQSTQPALRKLPYDPVKSFTPVSKVASIHLVLVVHPSIPASSAKELIALAKRRPGEILFSGTGVGAHTTMVTELFKVAAGVNIVIIEFKSGGPAVIDLLGGHTHAMLATISSVLPQIRAGKLKALATTGATRSALLPESPTIAESGLPGFATVQWHGIVAPAGTPATIVGRLDSEIRAILASDDTRKRFLAAGAEIDYLGPAEFDAFSRRELELWANLIRKASIRMTE